MTMTASDLGGDRAAALEHKLDVLTEQMAYLVERQRWQEELIGAMAPIVRVGLDGAIEKLDEMERAGYFDVGRELLQVVDRVVKAYTREDVERLGDNIVAILDTVRNITQPDVLELVNDVAGAVHTADGDPKGAWAAMRAIRKDPEVRRGVGMTIALLKQVGRAADKIGQRPLPAPEVRLSVYGPREDGHEVPGWIKHLRPSRRPAPPPPRAPTAPDRAKAACAVAPTRAPVPTGLPAGYGEDGFFTDPAAWTRETAEAAAPALGVPELDDVHWQVIEWARKDYEENGASPNVRRLSQGAQVSIRDLYQAFPGRPGILIAQIAGIPKPGGCL